MKQAWNGFWNRIARPPLISVVVEFSEMALGGVDAPEPSSEELGRQKGLFSSVQYVLSAICVVSYASCHCV